jgi:two-component system sensor histidine kinase KdpD
VDRGPGRYGDSPRGNGVGLGLAVARGFTEAIDGTLHAEDAPDGGLTMVLTLPVAASHPPPPEPDVSPT